MRRRSVPEVPLSPRGDYRAPSDSEATAWLEEIKRIPDSDPEHNLR